MSEKHIAECNRLGALVAELQRENATLRQAISDGDAWMKHAAAAEAVALRYYQALDEITDLTDGMADVEDRPDGEGVRPNIFMRIDAIVAEALAKNPNGSTPTTASTGRDSKSPASATNDEHLTMEMSALLREVASGARPQYANDYCDYCGQYGETHHDTCMVKRIDAALAKEK